MKILLITYILRLLVTNQVAVIVPLCRSIGYRDHLEAEVNQCHLYAIRTNELCLAENDSRLKMPTKVSDTISLYADSFSFSELV